jgi:cell fate (sporulation/competence/biofilm development) regulator YmcA (YheA/YmcA/DUF963 family)
MATHEPKFMDEFRTHEARRAAAETLTKHVEKVRKTKPMHGFVHGIQKRPILTKVEQRKTMAEIHNEMIAVKPFHVYSKAGKPK